MAERNSMDADEVLAQQMFALGRLGPPFADALRRAQALGVSDEFLSDASALLRQLSGRPGAGALDCIRDAPKDLASTEAFLATWQPCSGTAGCGEVLKQARATAQALREFNDTIQSLSRSELLDVQLDAAIGQAHRKMLIRKKWWLSRKWWQLW